jgi:hypothetical protein
MASVARRIESGQLIPGFMRRGLYAKRPGLPPPTVVKRTGTKHSLPARTGGVSSVRLVGRSSYCLSMRGKRRNPNWGMPPKAIPHVATEFESQVRQLGLTKRTYAASAQLRTWCERNKNRCYIPEWLLAEWGITVDALASPTRRPEEPFHHR